MNIIKQNKEQVLSFLVQARWIWHVAFWALYFSLEVPNYLIIKDEPLEVLRISILQDVSLIGITYTLLFIWFPLLYNRKQYILFVLAVLLNAMLFNFFVAKAIQIQINNFIHTKSLPDISAISFYEAFIQGITVSILFSMFIVVLKLAKKIAISQYHENQKKKYQMQSELDNLKAQLSPHFLFNTMNNFYGLAVEKSSKLPDLMLRLSDLIRYSLYETKNETVLLSSEINHIFNYIELEKIRLEDTLQLVLSIEEKDMSKYKIAPLLLIVFLENAFKHSRNSVNEPIKINVSITILEDDYLEFIVKNNYFEPDLHYVKPSNDNGIGIENVKKRLAVIYPSPLHSLVILTESNFYTVVFKVKLTTV